MDYRTCCAFDHLWHFFVALVTYYYGNFYQWMLYIPLAVWCLCIVYISRSNGFDFPKSRKRLPRLVRDLVLGVMGILDLQVIFPAQDVWVLFPVPNLLVLFLTLDLLGTSLFPPINLLLYFKHLHI